MAITPDSPIYRKAFEKYLRKGIPIDASIPISTESTLQHTTRSYLWRTQEDDKVRPSHAANDGMIFQWALPPATGNPGDAFGCRCWAVPIPDNDLDKLFDKLPLPSKLGFLLAGVGISIVGGTAGRTVAGPVVQRIVQSLGRSARDILNPNGKPIGVAGNRPGYREVQGGDKAAQELYKQLSKGGVPDTPASYAKSGGIGTRLSNGDWVGYRAISKGGEPAIDMKIDGVPYTKIKFPE